MYVEIPENLTERTVILEFGADAYRFYQNRIEERKRNGKIYYNPLKTIYIWAVQDRKYHQGYWSINSARNLNQTGMTMTLRKSQFILTVKKIKWFPLVLILKNLFMRFILIASKQLIKWQRY